MKKRLLVGLFALLLGASAVTLTSCKSKEEKAFEKAKANISTVLGYDNRTSASIEGVVYQTTGSGYFVEDATGKIFVADVNNNVTVGDKVNFTGTYRASTTQYYVQVAKTNYFVTVAQGETTSTPVAMEVADVKALANDKANYGKFVTLVGTLAKDNSVYTLKDLYDNTVYINDVKTASVLDAFDAKRIEISAVLESYNSANSTWNLGFGGSSVTEKALTVEDIKAFVKASLDAKMPTEVYGYMNSLKQTYSVGGNEVKLTWTVKEGESVATDVTISEEGAVDFVLSETEHNYTFIANAVIGEDSTKTFELSYNVKANAIEASSIKFLMDAYNDEESVYSKISKSYVKFNGVIIAKVTNQSGTLFGFAVKDQTNDGYSVQVDVTAAQYAEFEIGDVIAVTGQFRTVKDDRVTVLTDSTKASVAKTSAVTVTYTDADCALIVDSQEDLEELAANWNSKYVGRLIKFVNPNLVWNQQLESKITDKSSAAVTYNTTATEYALHLNGDTVNATLIGLLRGVNTSVLNTTEWYSSFNVGLTGQSEALTSFGADFYAVPSYYSSTIYASLVIPTVDCIIPVDDAKALEFAMTVQVGKATDFGSDEPYTVKLPATFKGQDVVWTCEDTTNVTISAVAEEGFFTAEMNDTLLEDANVTLVATVGELSVNLTYTIQKNSPKTISEITALAGGTSNLNVNGYVVGFASAHGGTVVSTTSTTYGSYGLLISDGTKVMTLRSATGLATTKATGEWKLNGTNVTVGDYVKLTGCRIGTEGINFTANTMEIDATSHKDFTSADLALGEDITTINNDAELEAYVATLEAKTDTFAGSQSMKVIKLVGTNENPIYVGANTASYTVCFYYLSGEEVATNIDLTKQYKTKGASAAARLFVIPMQAQGAWGADWMIVNTPVTGFDSTYTYGSRATKVSDTNPANAFVGNMYLVLEYTSGDVYFSTLFGTFDLTAVGEEERQAKFVKDGFPTTVEGLADYEFSVPALDCFEITGITSDNTDLINITTTESGKVTAGNPSVDTDVKLTVNYKYFGVEKTVEVTVNVKAKVTKSWKLITKDNVSKLVTGTKIIIVATSGETTYALNVTSTTSDSATTRSKVEITFKDNQPVLPNDYEGLAIADSVDGSGECGIVTDATNQDGKVTYLYPNKGLNGLTDQATHTTTTDWIITADTTGVMIKGVSRAAYLVYASDAFTCSTTNDYSVKLYAYIG